MSEQSPESPRFSEVLSLSALSQRWKAELAEDLRPLGLTVQTLGLLGHIRSTPGISFSQLARRARISVQSAHAAVAGFQEKGFITDETARAGAASRLAVTSEGELALDRASRVLAETDARFAAELPEVSAALLAWFEGNGPRSA